MISHKDKSQQTTKEITKRRQNQITTSDKKTQFISGQSRILSYEKESDKKARDVK